MKNLLQQVCFLIVLVSQGCEGSWFASPSFQETPINVTVREGAHAFLPCRVTNLGDRSVTWIKKKTLHIITAGVLTYSPDDRYRVLHPQDTDEWTLLIRYAQKHDDGWYECQVNSDPKITRPVLLIVKDKNMDDPFYEHEANHNNNNNNTIVYVEDPKERYIQQGSILAVKCTVLHEHNKGPNHVEWYHGAMPLDYDSPRGGISLQTDKKPEKTISKLMLSSVTPKDSGRYSCHPTTGGYASLTVHVQSGQHQAAVHISGINPSWNRQKAMILTTFIYLFVAVDNFL